MLANLIQGDEKFDMQVHVREWVNIDPEWEFRTFITNNEMNACTQYYSLCYVPEMVPVKDAIRDKIYNFWREHLRALPYFTDACKGDYTVDFVLSPDLKVIRVIEVNNPPPVAGTSLFGALYARVHPSVCNLIAKFQFGKTPRIVPSFTRVPSRSAFWKSLYALW
jgi:hypothetical protein